MLNWILTSSVLIIIILLVRKLFGEKLTPGLQYGLWLLVLLRLLIPVSFFHSGYSLSEMVIKTVDAVEWAFVTEGKVTEKMEGIESIYSTNSEIDHTYVGGVDVRGEDEVESYIISSEGEKIYSDDVAEETEKLHPGEATPETITYLPAEEVVMHTYIPAGITGRFRIWLSENVSVLYAAWFIGMGVMSGIFLLLNLFFRIRIYSDREEIEEEELEKRELFSEIPVYVSKFVATPCIAGLRRSAVYLPLHLWKKNINSEDNGKKLNRELDAMICHENVHFRHGDQLWGFLRLICLVVHWYNPFVWMAALASKQDAELFCDAGTVKELGEEQRYEYGRILIRMTAQEKKNCERFSDALGHAGLCNTEMTDTKKHIERRIKKLTQMPKKSTIAVTLICLFVLMAVSYLFIGSKGRDSLFWEMLTRNTNQQGEVIIKEFTSEQEGEKEENFIPRAEDVKEVRAIALAGMSEEEIKAFDGYIKEYHNWLEGMLIYGNWESVLSDKENIEWNYIDQTGEIMIDGLLEDDPEYYLEIDEETRKYLQEKYPEYGQIPLEELRLKYGEPVYSHSWYGADTVIRRVNGLTASAENEIFQTDVKVFCDALQKAKDTHEVSYIVQAHEIVHDMAYFLLQYGPHTATYEQDRSSLGKYYGSLEVWRAWQEGTLPSKYSGTDGASSESGGNPSKAEQLRDDYSVMIGNLKIALYEDRQDITDKLMESYLDYYETMADAPDYPSSYGDAYDSYAVIDGALCVYFKDGICVRLSFMNAFPQTARGIQIGDSYSRLIEQYGDSFEKQTYTYKAVYDAYRYSYEDCICEFGILGEISDSIQNVDIYIPSLYSVYDYGED